MRAALFALLVLIVLADFWLIFAAFFMFVMAGSNPYRETQVWPWTTTIAITGFVAPILACVLPRWATWGDRFVISSVPIAIFALWMVVMLVTQTP